MKTNNYSLGAVTNTITLVIGLFLGFLLGSSHISTVIAQAPQPSAPAQRDYEDVVPSITTGTFGAHTIIAHRIGTDELQLSGYDVVKLFDGIVNLLIQKKVARYSEIDAILERAIPNKTLRMKPPEQPKAPPQTKPQEPPK